MPLRPAWTGGGVCHCAATVYGAGLAADAKHGLAATSAQCTNSRSGSLAASRDPDEVRQTTRHFDPQRCNDYQMSVDDASIDELLDRAVAAINCGDQQSAAALAGQVLAADGANADAEDLLTAISDPGEIRRLTIFFADLVDSTALSGEVEPETYRLLVGRYRELVQQAVSRYDGHIGSTKGDGLLAVFGHPVAHEDDARRAVHAGLEITRQVARLSEQAHRRFGIEISVRVGVHRGLVYLDVAQDDVYGLAANLAARVCSLAPPGAVVVSESVELLVRNDFQMEAQPDVNVKGVDRPVSHYRVTAELERPRRRHGPLVGRDRELRHLKEAWAHARNGTLTTPGTIITGEAGIGKSRLVAAAAEVVEAAGAPVLELIGSPFHTDSGLHPVRMMLERRCGIDRSTDQAGRLGLLAAEIGRCGLVPDENVPLLAPVLGIDAKTGYEPVAAEGRKLYELIAQSVRRYLQACLNCSALVVAEDVHWFDPSTREVLGTLLDCADGRLMIVITGRPGDWLSAGSPATVFDLAPLTDAQTDTLISALNPGLKVDERQAVAARCDGVPFYVEQIVAGLGVTGVPEMLYEPLFARLRASPKVVPVVEAAAVIGRHVDRGLLGSVVDLSDDEVDRVIVELEDALVLERWGADGWRFRHELLREVAAELAPPTIRKLLHARVADALIDGGEPDWGTIAGHYERAEQLDKAVSAYQSASTAALLRGALSEAREYLTRALTQLDRAAPNQDRDRLELALRAERGRLTGATEGYQSAAAGADYGRCLQLAGTDLRDDELFATLAGLRGYYVTRADLDRTMQVLESLAAGVHHGRQWFRPVIDEYAGMVSLLRGDLDTAEIQLGSAISNLSTGVPLPDRYGFSEPLGYAYIHLALQRFLRGDLAGAEAEVAHAALRCEQLSFPAGPYFGGYAKMIEFAIRGGAGQTDRAELLAAELSELGERHGFDIWRLVGAVAQAAGRRPDRTRRRWGSPEHALGAHHNPYRAARHPAKFRREHIQHPDRRGPRAPAVVQWSARTGPLPTGGRFEARTRHRNALLRSRIVAVARADAERTWCAAGGSGRRGRTGPAPGCPPVRITHCPRRLRSAGRSSPRLVGGGDQPPPCRKHTPRSGPGAGRNMIDCRSPACGSLW